MIEMLRPPIVTAPDRCAPSFGATVTRTVPPPSTLEAPTPIQLRLELAGNEQSVRSLLTSTSNASP